MFVQQVLCWYNNMSVACGWAGAETHDGQIVRTDFIMELHPGKPQPKPKVRIFGLAEKRAEKQEPNL